MTVDHHRLLFAAAALSITLVIAGCAAPAAEPKPPVPPGVSSASPPAQAAATTAPSGSVPAAPAASTAQAPAPPSPLSVLATILALQTGDAEVQISRTAAGALLLRATGDAAFNSGSASPSPRFNRFLQDLAKGLLSYPTLSAKVSGHTDSIGSAQVNDRLSEARARNTVNRLISLGVPASRLAAEGKGQREPIASNDNVQGRAANRRVDVVVVESAH